MSDTVPSPAHTATIAYTPRTGWYASCSCGNLARSPAGSEPAATAIVDDHRKEVPGA